ncbi:NB-ARC domain-containing protein [Paractinoplanes rishiriensis]|uniref:NB-ARC domain-containing protein n=1 Tax=Paractinoplanes rishiriensis TaxID=1050105 RepID=A0A919JU03_9ACTN|nr:NB-ARC domain-containing protein [Actinoplanes rishiriensis]GIE94770.1 hypothetical protein Ari01nite_22350 [Actinoplanes rishiriensis]
MTTHGDEELARFKQDLGSLRVSVGNPPNSWFRPYPHSLARSTLHDLLTGPRKPRWVTVELFLTACENYARTDPGRWPDDPEGLVRSAWLARYVRLSGAPGQRPAEDVAAPADRRRIGVVPQPAGGYQDRGLSVTFDSPGPRQHVLTGLGGVGKTQIAASLARRLWAAEQIDDLIWVEAGSRDRILNAYRLAWEGIGEPQDDDEQAAGSFLTWLETTDRRWLVVLDDLADPAHLRGLWPPVTPTGRTVVTTRRTDAALSSDGRTMVRIHSFARSEALNYVRAKLSGRPELGVGADGLVAELGGLPLALAQAVVYQLDLELSCSDYLARLRRQPLRNAAPETLPDDQPAALTATWALSLRHADGLRPAGLATPVLRIAALLDPNGIPENVFTTAAVTAALGIGADDARDALRCLRRVSLIDIDPADQGWIRVHALVQRVTREETPAGLLGKLRRATADALVELLPGAAGDRQRLARLHANAATLIDGDDGTLYPGGVHRLVFETGRSLARSGSVEAAIGHFARAGETAAGHLGADHTDVLELRLEETYRLGIAEYYDDAATRTASLIDDCERVLGHAHQHTLDARLYRARWTGHTGAAAAIPLLTELTAELTELLGAQHDMTLTARNDLAFFRGEAGDASGAAEEFRLLAADRQALHGPRAEHTLISRNGYGVWLGKAGRVQDAIDVMSEVCADCAAALGADHQYTLGSRGNLVVLLGRRDGPAAHLAELAGIHARLLELYGDRHRQTSKFEAILRDWRQLGTG